MDSAIKLEHWSVQYPDKTLAVDDIDLAIHAGERVALIGGNGAGKSSLILSLACVLNASGMGMIGGFAIDRANAARIRQKVGVLFQNPDDQLFMPTIGEDVAFGPKSMGLDDEHIANRVDDRLSLLGILHLKERTPLKLSGGEKRLAALAGVLAMKPDIMLMDEPTAYLDPRARRNLAEILNGLPHTMLIATHDMAFAQKVCGTAVIMNKGKVIAHGPTKPLINDEAMLEAAGL